MFKGALETMNGKAQNVSPQRENQNLMIDFSSIIDENQTQTNNSNRHNNPNHQNNRNSQHQKKPYKYKDLRVSLAFIMFSLSLVLSAICGIVLYMTIKTTVTYMMGFLVSILMIIGIYWFNTFFDQLTYREKPDHSGGVTLIKRKTRRVMSDIIYFLNIILLVGWSIVFVKFQLWTQFV